MRFGICTSYDRADAVKAAGWDFIEECVQTFHQGLLPDDQWHGMDKVFISALQIPAANMLVPGDLKITGPAVDAQKLRMYITRVIQRAGKTDTRKLVFGSGGARNVPDGFDRETAKRQIREFIDFMAPLLAKHHVTLVIEPLNRKECNIINSVAEAMEYVKAVNHPNFQCLVDSYHLWLEDEPVSNVLENISYIRHVHLADTDGRVAPGLSGSADYRPLFKVLKQGNYDGLISVEALNFDVASDGEGVLEFVKKQWSEA